MKLGFRDIASFLKAPPKNVHAVLLYGPDIGLASARRKQILSALQIDESDGFRMATMNDEDIKSDPSRFLDEANALSMMGGMRAVRVRQAGIHAASVLKDYLKAPNEACFVIVEAGDLKPADALRKLFENSKTAAALPCYKEEGRDLARVIQDTFQTAQKRIDPDAVQWLLLEIGGDHMRARSELEKLIVYAGDAPHISLEDARAIINSGGDDSYDVLTMSIGSGRTEDALHALDKLFRDGTAWNSVLRVLQNHFRRVHLAQSIMANGETAKEAMKQLKPPVFFKQADDFAAHVHRWPPQKLRSTLARLAQLEADCKKTGALPETLIAQAVLGLSRSAA